MNPPHQPIAVRLVKRERAGVERVDEARALQLGAEPGVEVHAREKVGVEPARERGGEHLILRGGRALRERRVGHGVVQRLAARRIRVERVPAAERDGEAQGPALHALMDPHERGVVERRAAGGCCRAKLAQGDRDVVVVDRKLHRAGRHPARHRQMLGRARDEHPPHAGLRRVDQAVQKARDPRDGERVVQVVQDEGRLDGGEMLARPPEDVIVVVFALREPRRRGADRRGHRRCCAGDRSGETAQELLRNRVLRAAVEAEVRERHVLFVLAQHGALPARGRRRDKRDRYGANGIEAREDPVAREKSCS